MIEAGTANREKLRIVMIGPFGLHSRGTMAVRALPMAQALARRGHTVTALLPPWQNPEDEGKRWQEDGVAVENIELPPAIPALFHLLTALRLACRALSLRADVVHLFKPKAYSGLTHWLLARAPRRRRPRLVVDSDDWEGPGGWNELAPYTRLQRAFFTWQERWGLTHADAVTVASRTLESLVWALGVPTERVFYVPNGALVRPSAVQQTRDAESATILLYTRFFEFPVSRVVEILQRVRQAVPAARLLVLGQGLFGEEEALLRQARCRGLEDAIEYAGWVDARRLPEFFRRATLAIYPFDDTLVNRTKCPVKLLDLLAAGVPVVAEAVGEIALLIQHEKSGWLVEPGDVEGFVEGVTRLLKDLSLREKIGRGGARQVRSQREWNQLAGEVAHAYRQQRG